MRRAFALLGLMLAFFVTPAPAPSSSPLALVEAQAQPMPQGIQSRGIVDVFPQASGGDDAAGIIATGQANAYSSCVVLHPGRGGAQYHWNVVGRITRSGVCLRAMAGVKIRLALTERGSPASPYNAMISVDQQTSPLAQSSLAAAVPPGARWLVTTGLLNGDGKALSLNDALLLQDDQTPGAGQQAANYTVLGGYQLGTVALVGGVFGGGGSLDGKTLILTVNGVTSTTTFSAPANLAAALAAINAAVGSTVATNDINAFLVLRSTAPIIVGAGTANTAIGVTAGTSVALDRPTLYAGLAAAGFPSGATVSKYTRVDDLDVDLGGAEIVAGSTYERVVSCAGCRRFRARNVLISAPGNEYAISSDTGGYDNAIENVLCAEGTTACVAIEATEQASARNVVCTNSVQSLALNTCMKVQASRNVLLEGIESTGKVGLAGDCINVGDSSDVIGSDGVTIVGARCIGNTNGLVVTGGSHHVACYNCMIERSTSHGVLVQAQTSPTRTPGDVTLWGGTLVKNGGSGLYVDGAARVKMIGTRSVENGAGAAQTINGGELSALAVDVQENLGPNGTGVSGGAAFKVNSSSDLFVLDASRISSSYVALVYGVLIGGGTARITNTRFTMTGGGFAIAQTGGASTLGGNETTVATDYGMSASAGTIRRLDNGAGFANCVTPWVLSGSVTGNFGSLTCNGVTEVTTTGAFPANAAISFWLTNAGTTPCLSMPYFSSAQIAGTFKTKAATASCNSVLGWQAQ